MITTTASDSRSKRASSREKRRATTRRPGDPPAQHSFDRARIQVLEPEHESDTVLLQASLCDRLCVEGRVGGDDDIRFEDSEAMGEHVP